MKIETKTKYEPKAGDILSWKSGTERILFIVIDNRTIGPSQITGITLRDNRSRINNGQSHIVMFSEENKLALQLENIKTNIEDKLSEMLSDWDEEEESAGLSALFD